MSEILELKELPEGWVWTTLGDIFKWGSGGTPKRTNSAYYGGEIPWLIIRDLNDGAIGDSETKINENGLKNSSAKWVEVGSVLVAMYGSIGKLGIATERLTTNQAIAFTHPGSNNGKYLFYYLMHSRSKLASKGKGIAQKNISQTVLKAFPFPLAPPEQQKQIVAKIEQLFSHIDSGIESLNTAKQCLKQYRQSVLKAAVTGELTKEWREANESKLEPVSQLLERILQTRRQKWEELQLEQFKTKGKVPKNDKWKEKYKAPKVPVMHMDLESPEEWEVASVDQVAEVFLGKMLDKSKHTTGERLPYLRNINVRWGRIDTNDLLEMFFKESELKRFKVIAGDVLVCEGGEPGRAAVWKETNTTIKYQKALHRVRFYLPILPQYLVYLLEYFASTGLLAKYFTGSTIKHFTKEAFITLPFPLPSLIEMQQIISVVDEKMYSIRRLENEINTQLLKAQKTKQSILASAFVGKLTVTPKGAEI